MKPDPFPEYVVTNDPFERTMSKINRQNKKIDKKSALLDEKYTKVVKNDKEIYRYPMREASFGSIPEGGIKINNLR